MIARSLGMFLLLTSGNLLFGQSTEDLNEAIQANDVQRVRDLLDQKAPLNSAGFSPLHLAARNGYLDILKVLLAHGANVNARNDEKGWFGESDAGRTPLHEAAENGHGDAARLLIAHGAKLNAVTDKGLSIPHVAVRGKLNWLVKDCIAAGVRSDFRDENGWTPLHEACLTGDLELVKLLLPKTADINAASTHMHYQSQTDSGTTPLYLASLNGHTEIVRWLLDHKADINKADAKGRTALVTAARLQDTTTAMLLIRRGANVNISYEPGFGRKKRTILADAVGQKNLAIFRAVLTRWVDKESLTSVFLDVCRGLSYGQSDGPTLLIMAHELLEYGAGVNFKDDDGHNAIGYLARQKADRDIAALVWKVIPKLDSINSPVRLSDHDEDLLTNWAAKNGDTTMLKVLMQWGANINLGAGYNRRTPILNALWYHQPETVAWLAAYGADVNTTDEEGLASLHHALQGKQLELVPLLLRHGAHVDQKTKDRRTPLHFLCESAIRELDFDTGELESDALGTQDSAEFFHMFDLLLSAGAPIGDTTAGGRSVLHLAAEKGNLPLVRRLVKMGLDINDRDQQGWTAFHWALFGGSADCARFLHQAGSELSCTEGWNLMLFQAASMGLRDVARDCLKNNADVNAVFKRRTPLQAAAWQGHSDMARLLLDRGALDTSRTLLHAAAKGGLDWLVKRCLDKGRDPNAKDKSGFVPIMYAAENGHDKSARLLVPVTDLSAADQYSYGTMHAAARGGLEWLVDTCLAHGSQLTDTVSIYDREDWDGSISFAHKNRGYNMLHCVAKSGLVRTAERCLQAGVRVDKGDLSGRTPLHEAAKYGQTGIARLLIEHGADINRGTEYNVTPLHEAAEKGRLKVIQLLVDAGASVNAVERLNSHTPLDKVNRSDTKLSEYLRSKGARKSKELN